MRARPTAEAAVAGSGDPSKMNAPPSPLTSTINARSLPRFDELSPDLGENKCKYMYGMCGYMRGISDEAGAAYTFWLEKKHIKMGPAASGPQSPSQALSIAFIRIDLGSHLICINPSIEKPPEDAASIYSSSLLAILVPSLIPMANSSPHSPKKGAAAESGTENASESAKKGLKVLLLIPCFHFNRAQVNFAMAIYRAIRQHHQVHVIMPYAQEKEIKLLEEAKKSDAQLAKELEFFDLRQSTLTVNVVRKEKDDRGVPTGKKVTTQEELGAAIQDDSFSTLIHLLPYIWKEMLAIKYGIKEANEGEEQQHAAQAPPKEQQQYDVGIADFSLPNQYAFAVFHALGIKHKIVTRAYSPNGQNYDGLGVLQAAIDGHLPPVDKTELSDIFLNLKVPKGQEEKRKQLEQRYEQIENEYNGMIRGATKGIKECDALYQVLPGFENFHLLEEFQKADFYFGNTQPEFEFDNGAVLSMRVGRRAGGHSAAAAHRPEVAMVGGIHLQAAQKQPRPLNEVIQEKMQKLKSVQGIVLISFGTVFKTAEDLTHVHFEAIRAVIRQRPNLFFIWHLSEKDKARIDKLNEESNVFSAAWVDQPAILAHPLTIGLISNCGRNSQYEATFFGVPLICVPVFMDQFYNAVVTARNQRGLFLDFFCLELKGEQYQLAYAKHDGNPVLETKGTLLINYEESMDVIDYEDSMDELHDEFLKIMEENLKKWETKTNKDGNKPKPFHKLTHPSNQCFTKKNIGHMLEEVIHAKKAAESKGDDSEKKAKQSSIDISKLMEAKKSIRAHPAQKVALEAFEKISKKIEGNNPVAMDVD